MAIKRDGEQYVAGERKGNGNIGSQYTNEEEKKQRK